MNNRKPLIHIGMPKTATKTLQWRLFSRHREVFYLGRYDGQQFVEHQRFNCCRDKDVQTLMHQIAHGPVYNPDFNLCEQIYKNIQETARVANLVPVWSWESYSTDVLSKRQIRARNLRRVFGDANILMVIRNPISLLESAYYQHIKRENVSTTLGYFTPPYYQTINEWLRDNFHGEILPHLQYAETAQVFVKHFGRENVHVLLFEDLVANEEEFYRGVCRLMQIDADEGMALVSGERENERWTKEQVDVLARTVNSPIRSFFYRLKSRAQRLRLLGLDGYGVPLQAGERARAMISPAWKEEIFKTTCEGNRWLEEQFQLPLHKHAYQGGNGRQSWPLCLHIGLSKTATTTLQKSLFRRHPQIRYLGQYVPSNVSMCCESEEVYRILRPILWETDEAIAYEHARTTLMPILQQAIERQQRLVASWEGLVSRSTEKNSEMLRRATRLFGGCKILLTLRNPLTRLPSEYLENLKGHFIKKNNSWMGRAPYITFDEWLSRAEVSGHFQSMISYCETIQQAVQILGREQVGVFLFEELQVNPISFYSKLCRFLEIDIDQGIELTANRHLHPRRTEGEIRYLQSLNSHIISRMVISLAGNSMRRKLLERKMDGMPATSPEFPGTWREKIIQLTGPGHVWLSKMFQLPLKDFGYPLGES